MSTCSAGRGVGTLALVSSVLSLTQGSASATPHDFQLGDVVCGVMGGNYQVYDNNGVYIETIYDGYGGATTGAAYRYDPSNLPGRLYLTDFSFGRVLVLDGANGHALLQNIDTATAGGWNCESVVLAADGGFYVGHIAGTQDVQRNDGAGGFLSSYDVGVGPNGSDWVELACDQSTLYYTSEGTSVRRYDLGTSTQLADFASGLPGNAFALRLLPPLDGSGGMLVACQSTVVRLNATGSVVQTYDVAGEDYWFTLDLDPNGTSFWAGDLSTANFYRFDIASGAVQAGPFNTGTGYGTFAGLAVVGAPSGANNQPPVVLDGPCNQTFTVPALAPLSYVLFAGDPNPGDFLTLTASGVPPAASHTPPLPLVGLPNQSLSTSFQWTPSVIDVGPHTILYDIADAACGSTGCSVQLNVTESYLIIGVAPGVDVFSLGGHAFGTQISSLREWHVATDESTPAFDAPPLKTVWFRPGPFGSGGTSGLSVLDSFCVQALRYDPTRPPSEVERSSGGLRVRLWNNGQVTAEAYGGEDRLHVDLDLFVGAGGKRQYRFLISEVP